MIFHLGKINKDTAAPADIAALQKSSVLNALHLGRAWARLPPLCSGTPASPHQKWASSEVPAKSWSGMMKKHVGCSDSSYRNCVQVKNSRPTLTLPYKMLQELLLPHVKAQIFVGCYPQFSVHAFKRPRKHSRSSDWSWIHGIQGSMSVNGKWSNIQYSLWSIFEIKILEFIINNDNEIIITIIIMLIIYIYIHHSNPFHSYLICYNYIIIYQHHLYNIIVSLVRFVF